MIKMGKNITLVTDFHVALDFSYYSKEVIDYIIDQLPDRVARGDLSEHELELENLGNGVITVSLPIGDLISKIEEEKLADIKREIRHGEREE